LTFTLFYRTI